MILTAVREAGTGIVLLILPSVPLALLLGVDQASPETMVLARIAGVALLAAGVACWLARNDNDSPAQRGLLVAVLIYDPGAAALLALAGFELRAVGIDLWPAVLLHGTLFVGSLLCICPPPRGGSPTAEAR